jgi:hypothetical protein
MSAQDEFIKEHAQLITHTARLEAKLSTILLLAETAIIGDWKKEPLYAQLNHIKDLAERGLENARYK